MNTIEPHRKIRLVQIGFGHIGLRRTFLTSSHPGIEVVGVADVKRERLDLARDVLGDGCSFGTDYTQLLQSVRPEAAIISTPNFLHAPIALNTLDFGVHVLCEKPLAIHPVMAEQCVAMARRKNLKLKVGSNHRFWRGVREILSIVSVMHHIPRRRPSETGAGEER